MSEAHVYKRLARARTRLQTLPLPLDGLAVEQYASRLAAVHHILYVLFTEGYLSSHAEIAIRQELCDEALRLDAAARRAFGRAHPGDLRAAPSPAVHTLQQRRLIPIEARTA